MSTRDAGIIYARDVEHEVWALYWESTPMDTRTERISTMAYKPTGYGDDYKQRHEAEQRAEQAEEQARQDANAAARKTYLAGLDTAQRARVEEDEARIEESLAPDRDRERRRWLAEHPDKSAADFYHHAWPQIRLNILEARDAATREETRQSLLRSGRYSAL